MTICQSEDVLSGFSGCENEADSSYLVDEKEFFICDDCLELWKSEGGVCEFCEEVLLSADETICDKFVCPGCYWELLEKLVEEFEDDCPTGYVVGETDTKVYDNQLGYEIDSWCSHTKDQHYDNECYRGAVVDIVLEEDMITAKFDNRCNAYWEYIALPTCPYCNNVATIEREDWGSMIYFTCEHQIGYDNDRQSDFTTEFPEVITRLRDILKSEGLDLGSWRDSFVDELDGFIREYLDEKDLYIDTHDCEIDGCNSNCNYYDRQYLVPNGWEQDFLKYLQSEDIRLTGENENTVDIQSLIVVAMLGGA